VRFLCTSAFIGPISFQNLLDIFNVAATAVTAFDLFTAVKIKAVEIWANGLTNASAVVTVVFDGTTLGAVGDQKVHTDTSMGIEPAHVLARPVRQSQAAQFQNSSAATAVFVNVPSGAIVDMELSFRNDMLGTAVATQNAPAGATPGALYTRGLDGVALAASKFLPVGIFAVD